MQKLEYVVKWKGMNHFGLYRVMTHLNIINHTLKFRGTHFAGKVSDWKKYYTINHQLHRMLTKFVCKQAIKIIVSQDRSESRFSYFSYALILSQFNYIQYIKKKQLSKEISKFMNLTSRRLNFKIEKSSRKSSSIHAINIQNHYLYMLIIQKIVSYIKDFVSLIYLIDLDFGLIKYQLKNYGQILFQLILKYSISTKKLQILDYLLIKPFLICSKFLKRLFVELLKLNIRKITNYTIQYIMEEKIKKS